MLRFHDEPFHTSAKGVPDGVWTSVSPTAMHQSASTQYMAVTSITGGAPVAAGVAAGTGDHEVPFHCSPTTSGVVPPTSTVVSASHTVVDTQETEVPLPPVERLQAVPFHISAIVPTAMQKSGPAHDTEESPLPVPPPGTLGTTDHDVPFHCSMSAPSPTPMFCVPTATQKVDVAQ